MLCAFVACGLCGAPVAYAQVLTFTEASVESGIISTDAMPAIPLSPNISGGAVGDFNNDGWQDLFVFTGGAEPDKLFINQQDGTFVDAAGSWGVDRTHYGVSATCADFNGDGWMDISVSSMGPSAGLPGAGNNLLYRNNGDGTFTEIAEAAGISWRVASMISFATAFGDYDGDGDLDMFSTSTATSVQGNRLWRNNLRETGDETFTDVTGVAGLDALIGDNVSGFVPGFADMDRDGHLDILLVADTGTSRYLKGSASGVFTDATSTVSRLNSANGMGLAIGDVNGDGLLDWYISSIEYTFLPNSGNLLFVQRPDGGFDEVGRASGVNQCGWGWGVLIVDLDHDGVDEIVATKNANASPSHVLKHNGNMHFADISTSCGFLHGAGGRGLVNFDMDNDGDQDVVVFTSAGPIGVWRNDLAGPNTNWLKVELDTSARDDLAPDGFGSVVKILSETGAHLQVIDGATNHCSSGEHGAHFGTGPAATLDHVRVEWMDGTSTTVDAPAANQRLIVRAPFHPGDVNGDDVLDMGDVVSFVGAFTAGSASADLSGDGMLDLTDLTTFIRWFSGQ
jgi:hypothetical protein